MRIRSAAACLITLTTALLSVPGAAYAADDVESDVISWDTVTDLAKYTAFTATCLWAPVDCATAGVQAQNASNRAKENFDNPPAPLSPIYGKRDAARHCIWNARMDGYMGAGTARVFADINEIADSGVSREMDFRNNQIGRDHTNHSSWFWNWGKDADAGQAKCISKAQAGQLWRVAKVYGPEFVAQY